MALALLQYLAITAALIALILLAARLLFPAPVNTALEKTTALPVAQTGILAQTIDHHSAKHTGASGILTLQNGFDAFAARIRLANAAVSSIDVQYYIWRTDMTGHLLFKALLRAADRGVRVRILLDDNGIHRLDHQLAEMDAHPNIEVRLYNPFPLRRLKRLAYAFDFSRLNHRMHNKAFTVDGRASILGGRNVGDEYFGTGAIPLQIDLDVLAVGEVVPTIAADFDRYWNADIVIPTARVLRKRGDSRQIETWLTRIENDPKFETYYALLDEPDAQNALSRGAQEMDWTDAVLVSDAPDIRPGRVPKRKLFINRLLDAVGTIENRFDGVTPYFVPGRAGVKALAALQKKGVRVRMLTNSLEATNMLPVHAGYSKHRAKMLRAGITLFELRAQAGGASSMDILGPLGSSGSNLHAKTFAVDGKRIFVGSFNFDPRSATLNTEMGLLIESAAMAERMHAAFDEGLSELAWRVTLHKRGPKWINTAENIETRMEPGTTFPKRVALKIVGWLPIEWLL